MFELLLEAIRRRGGNAGLREGEQAVKPLMPSAWNARVWAPPHGKEDAQPELACDDDAGADGPMVLLPLRTSVKLAMHLRSMEKVEGTTELRERGARGNEEKALPYAEQRNKHIAVRGHRRRSRIPAADPR